MAIPGVSPPKPFRDLKDLSRKSTLHASKTLITTEPGLGAAVTLTPVADIEPLTLSKSSRMSRSFFPLVDDDDDEEEEEEEEEEDVSSNHWSPAADSPKPEYTNELSSISLHLRIKVLYWAPLRYRRILKSSTRPVLCGQPLCPPIALFGLAGTPTPPSTTHWIVPILAGIPFGYGCVWASTWRLRSRRSWLWSACEVDSVVSYTYGAWIRKRRPWLEMCHAYHPAVFALQLRPERHIIMRWAADESFSWRHTTQSSLGANPQRLRCKQVYLEPGEITTGGINHKAKISDIST
ncbi:uncharacterized protein BO66DRAFT_404321 [Aspergillus aculeatinus CBS 121060]|uniref:Uncharacterized protein n=1 Tax=Aspergillus aculeatinus CBS 121060 TaxID=1448322 RepID=A0ACD1H0I6_9EURO|nr:hypothetical protein BO66DRAFT_404321 [Aspergillus aculeatinus CBS 121060]RAH66969.1 hypothetical protein BO66DRAFT_404321 [Aspergillus aculeatinus CBS 121060]